MYEDWQEERKRTENRLRTLGKVLGSEWKEEYKLLAKQVRGTEKLLKEEVAKRVRKHCLWREWLQYVKGIGPTIAAGLIGWLGGWRYICSKCNAEFAPYFIKKGETLRCPKCGKPWSAEEDFARWLSGYERFEKVSQLIAYVLGKIEEGKVVKRRRGERGTWNPKLRRLMYVLWHEQFLRQGKGYRELYDRFRAMEDEKDETPTPKSIEEAQGFILAEDIGAMKKGTYIRKGNYGKFLREAKKLGRTAVLVHLSDQHKMFRAGREVSQIFLSHLLEMWRKIKGLPFRLPYAFERMGHPLKHYIPPIFDYPKGKGKKA